MMIRTSDPEQMEALAYHEGLALVSDFELQKFRMATDCANMVKNIRGDEMVIYG